MDCFSNHFTAHKLWILPFGLEKFRILDEFWTGLAPPNGPILTIFGRLVTEKIVLGIYTWIVCIEIFFWVHSKRFCYFVSENSVYLTSYKCFCRRWRPRGSFGFVVSGRNKSSQGRKPMVYDSKRFYYDRALVQAIYFPENRCRCRVLAVCDTNFLCFSLARSQVVPIIRSRSTL